jgi:hypothetical protein
MFIPDPDFYPSRFPDLGSRIQDPKTAKKERDEKKFVVIPFHCHKFNKIVNYFLFEMPNKKIWANFQRIIELFTHKIVTKLSKIWVWDPGFEIRDPEKTYSGSRIQGSKRHRIPDPDPQHCSLGPFSPRWWGPVWRCPGPAWQRATRPACPSTRTGPTVSPTCAHRSSSSAAHPCSSDTTPGPR